MEPLKAALEQMAEIKKKKEEMRIKLVLGKFRVISRTELEMKVALGGSTTMTVGVEPFMDMREGDLITLYTEVLYAIPSQPSVQ